MTDEELIARLLAEETNLTDCAADRIEKLENSLAWYQMMDAMSSDHVVELTDKLEAAEAKLAKAEAYLQKISRHANRSCSAIAAHALAELEGK